MRKWMKNGAKLLMILSMLTAGVTLSACSFDFFNQNSESVSDTSSNVDSSSSYVPEILYEVKISINEWTMNVYEEVVLSAVATQDGEEIDSEIEWTSSDSTIATVVDGKVNALKTGTVTITASANGVLDTCVITVVNTAGDPQIMIDANEELQLRVGMTFQVAPTLVYNGSTYTDATFSFISGDSDVFTVSETGLITAVGEGDANLTVSASWRGLSGNDLTEVLRVKVIEDVAIALSNTETTTIYTTNKDFGNGQTYTNTVTYGATISLNGNVIDGSAVSTWNSSNTEVATIDPQTGVVTAVGVGETAITLSYVSASGRTYVSEEILLTVALPAIEKEVEVLMGANDLENPLLASDIFGEDEVQSIVSITDITDGAYNDVAYEDGKVTAELAEGTQKWLISNGEYGYIVDVLVVTNVIRSAEDLAIFNYSTKTTLFNGTFVLANDIDASGYVHHQNIGWGNYNTGLTGTFDGRGHTIDGLTLRQGGLFGVINSNSTVKNVAFTNVTLLDNGGTDNNVYTLASFICANSKIENVFISIKAWPSKADRTTAALMSQYKVGAATETPASFKNVVVVAPAPSQTMANARAFMATAGGTSVFENVHIISSVQGFKDKDVMEGVTKYATVADFEKNVNIATLPFDTMWDLTGAYPVFKSSAKVAPYTLELDQTTANVYCEESITLTASAMDILGNDASSAMVWTSSNEEIATVENGVVNALMEGSVTITVTIGNISMSCEITVEEKPEEVSLEINADNVATLYTTDKDLGDGKTYAKSATFVANATLNGEAITEGLVWSSDNTDVLTIDAATGVATAVGMGTANITVSYMGESGTVYTSGAFAVTVEMPVLETDKELLLGSADAERLVTVNEITNEAGFAISGILDANGDVIAYDAATNNVTATLTDGNYEWVVHNGEYGYKVNAWVVTNIIRKAEDLQIFNFNAATVVFDGTYVLANNIDASEYTHYTQFSKQNANGLTGTFDGRGYTIDGITISQCGLFGNVNGTIKNVAFTNVKLNGNWSVLFGRSFWYSSVIENVFIEIDGWTNVDGLKLISAPLFIHNKATKAARIENVVVMMPALPTTIEKADAVGSLEGATMASTTTYSNIYVISPVATKVNAVTNYENVLTFESSVQVGELAFGEMWDLTGAYPIFKTSEKVAPYTLTFNQTATEMFTRETLVLTASAVDMLGNDISSAIIWTSSNDAIATVENGVVNALMEGSVTITVMIGNISMSCEITVEEKPEEVSLEINADNVATLYTTDKDLGDGKTYEKSATFVANATLNGEAITEGLVWASDNTDVLTIDAATGVATAVGMGTANITVSYTGESGTTYTSESFAVTVKVPAIATDKEILLGSADAENLIAVNEITDEEDFVICGILDANGDAIAYDAATNNVTATLTDGNYEWIIHNGEYGYKVNAWVVTNIIRKAEDLQIFNYNAKAVTFAGTYVLANNIDASGYTHYTQVANANANGLTGVFDGRGYTIDGITLSTGGLFGNVGSGVIKNVAFTNVKLTGTHAYTLAYSIWYKAKIDNVYVDIESWPTTDKITAAALYGWVRSPHEELAISNVMIVTTAPTATVNALGSLKVVASDEGGVQHTGIYSNVFVLSSVTTNVTEVPNYATLAEFSVNADISVLTNAVWDLTGAYPVFVTSEKVVPYTLAMEETTAEMYKGETVTLTAVAKDFLGNVVDASAIEWASSETAIATVENGVVSGLTEGETTITATFNGLSVSCVVTVNQKQENVSVAVADDNVNKLYTANVSLGELVYNNATIFKANATLNGEAITEGLVWSSDNTDVLTIDATTGAATAVGMGTANITVSYTGESGTVYTSTAFAVSVEMPVLETGKEIVFGSADASNPVVVSQFANDENFAVSAIINAADNTVIEYDATANNVTATLAEGKYEWILHNGEYGYKVNVWVATNAIRTASDLAIFSVPDTAAKLAGTYVLANNIDASAYTHCMNVGWSSKANGLTGTFDGRGYTIDGITIRQGGLFGVISSGSIKNVALTNVKLSAADDKGGVTGNHLYVFATLVWYGVKIDNVYVEVDAWVSSASKTTAVLFHSVKKATPAISNVMIVTSAAGGSETTVQPVVCNAASATFSNVYVISPIAGTAITGVTQYSDVDTFKANVTTSALTGFNAYWDMTGDYPVFHTAK